jgi:hypothetical protein
MITAAILATTLVQGMGRVAVEGDFPKTFNGTSQVLTPVVAMGGHSGASEFGSHTDGNVSYPILISDKIGRYRFSEDGGFSNRWIDQFPWPKQTRPLANGENAYLVLGSKKMILVRRAGIVAANSSGGEDAPRSIYQVMVLERKKKLLVDYGWREGELSQVSLSPSEDYFATVESNTRRLFVGSTTRRKYQVPVALPKPQSMEFGGQDPYVDSDHPQSSQLTWLAEREVLLSLRDPNGLYRLSGGKATRIAAKAWLGFFPNTDYGIYADESGQGYFVKNFFKAQRICQVGSIVDSISTATSPSSTAFAFVNWDGQASDKYRRGYVLDRSGRKRAFELPATKGYRFGPTFLGERALAFSSGKGQVDVYDLNNRVLDEKSVRMYPLNVKPTEQVVITL